MADGSNDVTAIRRAALHEVGYAAASRGLKRKDNRYSVPSVEIRTSRLCFTICSR
jgi:hypothetical protein